MQRSGSGSTDARVDPQSRCLCGTGACNSSRPKDYLSGLPTNPNARKSLPVATGVLDYFPLAFAEIAKVSLAGQKQHGTTGWDRSKSKDEADALIRHFLDRGSVDGGDGLRHSAKMAWRALALLQKECERATMSNKEDYTQIVAWRVKDFADGWILFHDEHLAREEVAATGATIEPLYRLMKKSEVDQ